MKNQNLIKIKKVSEERYFKNNSELYFFVEKMTGTTISHMCDRHELYDNEILIPLYQLMSKKNDHILLNIGSFLCEVQRGLYVRTSGEYVYNLIAVQRSDNMTRNELKQLFLN
jgi:hypothetical protein